MSAVHGVARGWDWAGGCVQQYEMPTAALSRTTLDPWFCCVRIPKSARPAALVVGEERFDQAPPVASLPTIRTGGSMVSGHRARAYYRRVDREMDSEPSDPIRVRVGPDHVLLRAALPSEIGETLACGQIERLLFDEGVPSEHEIHQTGGRCEETLVVLLGSGGALSALVHVLHKFLDLRANKSIQIETSDGVTVMTKGASIGEFERVLRSTREPLPSESSSGESQGKSSSEESRTD